MSFFARSLPAMTLTRRIFTLCWSLAVACAWLETPQLVTCSPSYKCLDTILKSVRLTESGRRPRIWTVLLAMTEKPSPNLGWKPPLLCPQDVIFVVPCPRKTSTRLSQW